MTGEELGVVLAIALLVVASRELSHRTGIPHPVFLLVAGSLASFVPQMPVVHLNPKIVFLGFLPPLVYHAGFVTSPRELRANALPIGVNALGLVLVTTFAVALAVWAAAPGVGFVSAFVLGAIVAPTDPVAATSVLGRLGAPPRLIVVIEGESLVNDGIALSLFSLGIAAASTPTGIAEGVLAFLRIAGGGTLFGLAVGWMASRIRRPLRDTPSQLVVSLLIPFLAYLPADALGLSGVLSALTAGLVLGQQPLAPLQPAGRLRVSEFWEMLVFLLESVLFVLVGLQLREIVDGIERYSAAELALITSATVLVTVVARLVWQLVIPARGLRVGDGGGNGAQSSWQQRLVVGWSGMRGGISLAAALSIPFTAAGHPFQGRDLLLFATYVVIVTTLVGQGTSLPWLLQRLSLCGSEVERHQQALASRRCAEAALRTLDQLVADERVADDAAELIRQIYERRLERVRAALGEEEEGTTGRARPPLRSIQRRLLQTEHEVLTQLQRNGEISYSVMRRMRRELDLELASFGTESGP